MGSIIFSGPSSSAEARQTLFLSAVAGVVFLLLFTEERKIYDLATAMFFAFSLGLMVREKLSVFFAVFALANINRETSFLLTAIFAVYFWGRMNWRGYMLSVGYQLFIYFVVRFCLMVIFADTPGVMLLVRPLENIIVFVKSPIASLVHWAGFGLVVWLCVRRWKGHPYFLRVAFAVLMPALMVMYLVLGCAFEIRVFAEAWPVVWMMGVGDLRLEIED